MLDAKARALYWLLEGTKGGPTRAKIIASLIGKPANTRQLALSLGLDYKTVQGHIEMLAKNGILDAQGGGYGSVYFLSSELDGNEYLLKALKGVLDENKKR